MTSGEIREALVNLVDAAFGVKVSRPKDGDDARKELRQANTTSITSVRKHLGVMVSSSMKWGRVSLSECSHFHGGS